MGNNIQEGHRNPISLDQKQSSPWHMIIQLSSTEHKEKILKSSCEKGPGAVAQVVKVLTLHARDPIWVLVLIPEALLPFQLPACGKQSRTAQGFGTLHPCGRPRRGSWLWIGIASAVALTWGVNQWMEDLPLCLSSLYIHPSNKNNKK